MLNRFFLLFIFFGCLFTAHATHNRAGEITYVYLGGTTYGVTITTCTKSSSTEADRPELEISWGDGYVDTIPRIQIIPAGGGIDAQQNVYYGTHEYPNPATYVLRMYDPNRNGGILNISNSEFEPFCITSTLVVSPFINRKNNSVQFADCPCPEYGCIGQPYCFNPAVYDPDGDSLSFELVPCRGGADCDYMAVPNKYQYPGFNGGSISLNPVTGTFCWNSPQVQGEYNIAIVVHEWFKVGNVAVEVGNVTLDMQITIVGNCQNTAPVITPVNDTCVVAGSTLSFSVTASDVNTNDDLTLTASGLPFNFTSSPATFSVSGTNPATGIFNWTTDCSHVGGTPYYVTVSAQDEGGNSGTSPGGPFIVTGYETMTIRVVPPPVQNVSVNPQGNNMVVTWDTTSCIGATGYKIYRSNNPVSVSGSCCDAGTPIDLGYQLVGTVTDKGIGTFTDQSVLMYGTQYCYIVVVYYYNGPVSCPSAPACGVLLVEVPVITNVSVSVTDFTNGSDTVRWIHPFDLDTTNTWTGYYFYQLYSSTGFTNAQQSIFTSSVEDHLINLPLEYIHTTINTDQQAHVYKIELWHIDAGNNTALIGSSYNASSVFLTLTPSDNQISLSWQENVPWVNYLYEVYKETSPGNFVLLDTTSQHQYADTGLINGATYCYKIRSIGAYTDPQIPAPLHNWSQEECASPIDQTPPCAPQLEIVNDCTTENNVLTWTNPNNFCADDVMQYNVYYSETDTGQFVLIAQFFSPTDITMLHNFNNSLAGCYYVTAVDSAQYGNESLPSNIVCGDNCPEYTLPNVFSPNGDGDNDLFVPFPYRFVKDINIQIFNRWGALMFQTTDPDVNWDGTFFENGKDCSEGVYYYVCTVNTIRLQGIVPVTLKGFVHLFGKGSDFKR